MTAQKVTFNISVELLSLDCLAGLLAEVVNQVEREAESGSLQMADGDSVEWRTTRKVVTF